MTQPAAYDQTTSFDAFNPSSFPNFGRKLDVELENIETTTDEIRTNLALIQRDDGELANESVGRDQLANDVAMGVGTPASWVTVTAYSVRDSVIHEGIWYWCEEAHTSGTFATDLATGYWEEIADFTDFISELALSDSTPAAVSAGAGSAGVSEFASRSDHSHPYTAPTVPTLGLTDGGTQASGFTAASNTRYNCVFGAAGTITLPAVPAAKDVLCLHLAGNYVYTFNPNGLKINSSTANFPLLGNQTVIMEYTGATDGWV